MSYPKRSWFSLSFGVVGWIFTGFLVVGLILAVPAYLNLRKGWNLAAHGVAVTGHVTTLATSTHSCGKDDMDSCTDYNVGYAFEADGVMRNAKASVAESFYSQLNEGAVLPVRYAAEDPAVSEIEIGTTMIAAVVLGLLALVFAGLGGIGLAFRMRKAGRIVRVRDDGTMRTALVTGQERTNVRINDRQQFVLVWKDSAGAEGRSRYRRQEDLPPVGEAITVYADPDGLLPPVWEGDSGTR